MTLVHGRRREPVHRARPPSPTEEAVPHPLHRRLVDVIEDHEWPRSRSLDSSAGEKSDTSHSMVPDHHEAFKLTGRSPPMERMSNKRVTT